MAFIFAGYFMRKGGIAAYKCGQPSTSGGACKILMFLTLPFLFVREGGVHRGSNCSWISCFSLVMLRVTGGRHWSDSLQVACICSGFQEDGIDLVLEGRHQASSHTSWLKAFFWTVQEDGINPVPGMQGPRVGQWIGAVSVGEPVRFSGPI